MQYRRDIGVGLYETVLQEIEEELPKEKLRTNKKVKCKHSFAMCKFKSACKYAHQDAFNDIKVLCDMLKEAKGKANVERLTKSTWSSSRWSRPVENIPPDDDLSSSHLSIGSLELVLRHFPSYFIKIFTRWIPEFFGQSSFILHLPVNGAMVALLESLNYIRN